MKQDPPEKSTKTPGSSSRQTFPEQWRLKRDELMKANPEMDDGELMVEYDKLHKKFLKDHPLPAQEPAPEY